MPHCLGLTVVGEGVETKAQLEPLVNHGCDELQGYLMGKPVVYLGTQVADILHP